MLQQNTHLVQTLELLDGIDDLVAPGTALVHCGVRFDFVGDWEL